MSPLVRLLGYLRPYRGLVLAGTACLVLSIPCSLFHPLVWKFVVDEVVIGGHHDKLIPALGVMFSVHATGTLLGFLRTLALGTAGERFIFDLRNAVHEKFQAQALEYFHRRRIGDLTARAIQDVESLRDAVIGGVDEILASLLSFAFVAGVIIYLHWVIGLVTLVPLMSVAFLIFVFNQRVKGLYRRVRDRLGDVSAKLSEILSGIALVKAFAREDYELGRFRRTGEGYLGASLRGVRVRAVYMPSVMLVGFLSNVTMVGLGAWFVIQGSFTLGGLVAYRGYWWQLFSPVTSLATINELWQRANASAARIVEVLNEPESITDAKNPIELSRARGHIEFDQVSFGYEPGRLTIRGLTLDVPAGSSVGVVGPSGAGKSTLLSLLLRLYDPAHGSIRLDEHDLRAISQRSLRSQFAVVAQDAFLFNESVRDNIRYGRLDASAAEIEEAARLANAHDFVSELSNGYDTVIGERGVRLSGGQRQRLCIARAFLANPAVLLLDEATAAVEPESELLIQAALTRLMHGRTTFIVSHRLSMVRDTDSILVIRDGLLEERGTHDRLMATDGWYSRMYRLQVGEAELEPKRASTA
jgi:ABC-type multidrug transport system fused ATPase/permease subunit